MANGELITQIDGMLEKETIPPKAATRLMLQIMRQMYVDQGSLKSKMNTIYPAYRFIQWLGAAIGLMVIALVWGILTHQIEIVH